MSTHVLVTGASGFVGSFLVDRLLGEGYRVTTVTRSGVDYRSENHRGFIVSDISESTDWKEFLVDVDVVVHLAGLAHLFKHNEESVASEYMRVNFQATVNLANQARSAGVKRFVFISSIAVYGLDHCDIAINEKSAVQPVTHYGESKYAAEGFLNQLGDDSVMDVVIIRPPLVYDRGAPGNFGLLLKLVGKSFPMPFRMVRNCRSFVSRSNLTSFIVVCMHDRRAGNHTFLVSDDQDLSTPDLIRLLSLGMHKKPVLVPVPLTLLKLGASLIGRKKMYLQLCGSLQLDISKAKSLLGWSPVESAESAVKNAASPFKKMS